MAKGVLLNLMRSQNYSVYGICGFNSVLLISFSVNFGSVRNVGSFCQSCHSAQFFLQSTAVSMLVAGYMSSPLHYIQCFCNILLFFRMRDLYFCLAFEFSVSVEMCNSKPTVYCDIIASFVL